MDFSHKFIFEIAYSERQQDTVQQLNAVQTFPFNFCCAFKNSEPSFSLTFQDTLK